MQLNGTSLTTLLLAAAMGLAGICPAQQAPAAAPQGNFELLELKTTLEASARRISDLETQLAAQRAQNAAVTQSLTSMTNEAAQSRESYEQLRSLAEGLGISALEGASGDQVRERLLAALADLRLIDEQKRKLTEALMSLSESSLAYAKEATGVGEENTKKLEESLAAADKAVRAATATSPQDTTAMDLHRAKVVAVKNETGIAVINVGSRDGVKLGMPFAIFHNELPIARVMVVDVRKSVAGVVVQQLAKASEPIQTGDRASIDADSSSN